MSSSRKMFRCKRCRSEMASNGSWINLVNTTCEHELEPIHGTTMPQSKSENTTGPLIPTMSEAFHFDRIKLALKKTSNYINDYNTKRNKLRQDFINEKKKIQQQFEDIKKKCDERQQELQKKLEEKYTERNQALQNQINLLTKYKNNCVDTDNKMRKSLYDRKTSESDRQESNSKMAVDLISSCPLAYEYPLLLEFDPINRNNLDFDIENYGTITSVELKNKQEHLNYGPKNVVKEVSNYVNDPHAPKQQIQQQQQQQQLNNFDNEEKQNNNVLSKSNLQQSQKIVKQRSPEPGSNEGINSTGYNMNNNNSNSEIKVKPKPSPRENNRMHMSQESNNNSNIKPKPSPSPSFSGSMSLTPKITFKVQHVKETYKRRVVLKNITENDFPQILQKIRNKATGDADEFKGINYKYVVTTKNNKIIKKVHDLVDLTKEDIIHAVPE